MGAKKTYTDRQLRLALIAYADGKPVEEIGPILGLPPGKGNFYHVIAPFREQYGLVHGGGVPKGMLDRFKVKVGEPDHIAAHKRLRRGFVLPRHKEDSYIELLKKGLSIADARAAVGVS